MSTALDWLLAGATLATAALALRTRSARGVALARTLNVLCVAALCLRLSAPLVAAALALTGPALLALPVERADPQTSPARGSALSRWLIGVGAALIALSLASLFCVGYAPGQTVLGRVAANSIPSANELAFSLLQEHGLAALGLALVALSAGVALRVRREGR